MFCYKSNLDSISVVKFIIALCRLRTAAHRLLIETGRWVKPKPIALENRKCITCNIIEDEFHFILVCPMYSSFRHYIPKYYTNRPGMFKFIELLNNNNELIVKRLALYCSKAFEKWNIFRRTVQIARNVLHWNAHIFLFWLKYPTGHSKFHNTS